MAAAEDDGGRVAAYPRIRGNRQIRHEPFRQALSGPNPTSEGVGLVGELQRGSSLDRPYRHTRPAYGKRRDSPRVVSGTFWWSRVAPESAVGRGLLNKFNARRILRSSCPDRSRPQKVVDRHRPAESQRVSLGLADHKGLTGPTASTCTQRALTRFHNGTGANSRPKELRLCSSTTPRRQGEREPRRRTNRYTEDAKTPNRKDPDGGPWRSGGGGGI